MDIFLILWMCFGVFDIALRLWFCHLTGECVAYVWPCYTDDSELIYYGLLYGIADVSPSWVSTTNSFLTKFSLFISRAWIKFTSKFIGVSSGSFPRRQGLATTLFTSYDGKKTLVISDPSVLEMISACYLWECFSITCLWIQNGNKSTLLQAAPGSCFNTR